jgi:hypothetical protein
MQCCANSSLTRVQLVESALQLFKLLPSLAELTFRGQVLVVGKVFGSGSTSIPGESLPGNEKPWTFRT